MGSAETKLREKRFYLEGGYARVDIHGVRFRLDKDETVAFNAKDLRRSKTANLREVADADADTDGWVSEAELYDKTGLAASAYLDFEKLAHEAKRKQFQAISVKALRTRAVKGELALPDAPASLGTGSADLSQLPRKAFVPLAEYLAYRLAVAESYEAMYGEPGTKVFHMPAADLWERYSPHELFAAMAVLTAREGGIELALVRDAKGVVHLVEGIADKVELDPEITGFDVIAHTHPKPGARAAQPSSGDLQMTRAYDPDHRSHVISEDGWLVAMHAPRGGNDIASPTRLWTKSHQARQSRRSEKK